MGFEPVAPVPSELFGILAATLQKGLNRRLSCVRFS